MTNGQIFQRTIAKNLDLTPFTGVSQIVGTAFAYSSTLQRIVIPANVTGIGSHVFHSCPRTLTLIMLPVTPPTYNGSSNYTMWSNSSVVNADYPMYVPDESLEAYKTASKWSTKASYMRPMSEYDGQE